MNKKPTVDKIVSTTQFARGVKQLKSKHKNKELAKLTRIVDNLKHFKITTASHNHSVGNGVYDIHISGDIVLLYRYNGDILMLELELNNLADHKNLSDKINSADNVTVKNVVDATQDLQSLQDIIGESLEEDLDDSFSDIIKDPIVIANTLRIFKIGDGEIFSVGNEKEGWFAQIQNHGAREYADISKYPRSSPKEKSSAWGRIWKDGKYIKPFTGPLNVVRQDMIKFLQDQPEYRTTERRLEDYSAKPYKIVLNIGYDEQERIFDDIHEDTHWYSAHYNLDFDLKDHSMTIKGRKEDLDKLIKDYHLEDYGAEVLEESIDIEESVCFTRERLKEYD